MSVRFAGLSGLPFLGCVLLYLIALPSFTSSAHAAETRVVFVAGSASHSAGEHEYRAGCLLLKKCLDQIGTITSVVHSNGWPENANTFDGATAILLYADGGAKHPFLEESHRKIVARLMEKGVGLGCIHFAVEVPKDKLGAEILGWLGGYYEVGYSINPVWTPDFDRLPEHPITRGVTPFSLEDEWYFNIRFPADAKGITPVLTARPTDKVRLGPYPNRYPDVEKNLGREETLMWACERPNGGRSFGFTGGHFHRNWADVNFRKIVLNAILWMAKVEAPASGVQSALTPDDLKQNLDRKQHSFWKSHNSRREDSLASNQVTDEFSEPLKVKP